ILAFRRGDEAERRFWRRCLEDLEQNGEDLDHALALMERHNALGDAMARAQSYGARAREALAAFPDSAVKRELIEVVDFCVERAY
ncbi:MAG: polyprenyl synthetase family protein, partial [Kiloniellales bacterium]